MPSITCWAASTSAYLTELRAYGGLQSYPSRTKDPDPVDFSTGSVGIGATASIWSAIAQRYVSTHFEHPGPGRQIALVGDAELDEGPGVGSPGRPAGAPARGGPLDRRPQPAVTGQSGARASRPAASGTCSPRSVGTRSRSSTAPGCVTCSHWRDGELLEHRIDAMSNEEYQYLLRLPPGELRAAVAGSARNVQGSIGCWATSTITAIAAAAAQPRWPRPRRPPRRVRCC